MSQRRYQAGIVTTFTGVMILVLLTLMMFFAMRVGVFEQRVSSTEMRQKLAFHAAESGIHHAKEFLRANSVLIASAAEDIFPDTTVDQVGGEWPVWFDGWLAADSLRWLPCAPGGTPAYSGIPNHPCQADIVEQAAGDLRRDHLYFYSNDTSSSDEPSWRVPVDTASVLPGETEDVDVYALLCVLDVVAEDAVPVKGCVGPDDTPVGIGDGTYFMVTLLARGQADCDGDACSAEALVSEQVSNFGAAAGGRTPKVPLTTKSTFVPNGTAEVVPNPNAGGIGVPASVWLNANMTCGGSNLVAETGNWNTRHGCPAGESHLPRPMQLYAERIPELVAGQPAHLRHRPDRGSGFSLRPVSVLLRCVKGQLRNRQGLFASYFCRPRLPGAQRGFVWHLLGDR